MAACPSYLTLAVADLGLSTAFYTRFLGAGPTRQGADHCFFALESLVLALYSRPAMAAEIGRALGPAGAVALSWNLPSLLELERQLELARAAGAALLRPLHAKPWGAMAAWIADPEGHPWELVYLRR